MSKNTCPECGKPLPAGSHGRCPSCLLSLALGPALDETIIPAGRAEDRIGPYRLLEQIGEGAFGSVWMAEQSEPVRRRVALKILKLGMDTREVVARFEAERQALAMMDHPNIARVFDGGATETGRPYFVMELVRGVPITEFCDAHRLTTRQRLGLFISVCEAVQHAHQKGVIHRDLKPNNILVTEQDGRFEPKVIDFGVAKAMDEPLTDKTLFTRFHQFLGTPAYMSPEQAGLGHLDIDTRTDIYSLGVVLYELLTGHTPLDSKRLREAGYEAMLKTVREAEPPKPSTRLSTLKPEDLNAVANLRGEHPHRLHVLIRGDLDWIILKAMEKDRARRYASANGLAAELRRYLENEPISAHPPSIAYRFGKAWRRNRVVYTAGLAVVAALMAGLATSTWLFIRESHAFEVAREQRGLAEQTARNLRESLYRSEMAAAFIAWRDGRAAQARNLLEKQRPAEDLPELRGFDWRYLWSLSRPAELLTLTNAGSWALAVSPDGQILAGAISRRLLLWSLPERRPITTLGPHSTDWLFSATFSPDGKTLAVPHDLGFVEFWDVGSHHKINKILLQRAVYGVAWSADGKRLATGGGSMYDKTTPGEVTLWDTASWRQLATFEGIPAWVYQVAFSPDGRVLAASGGDGVVRIWDAASFAPVHQLRGHNGFVEPVAFTHDGKWLAAADEMGYVWLWDWSRARLQRVFKGHEGPIYSVIFSSDDQRLVTGSRDFTAKMWDMATGRELDRYAGHNGGVTTVRFLPGDQSLLTAGQDSSFKLWTARPRSTETLLASGTSPTGVLFTSGGRYLARVGWDEKKVTFFDPATKAPIKTMDGQEIAASDDGKSVAILLNSEVIFLDPVSLEETGRLDCKTQLGGKPSFSPGGKWLAFRRGDSSSQFAVTRVVIVDVAQRHVLRELETDDERWSPLFFARGGELLLTLQRDTQRTVVWDTATWRVVQTLSGSPAQHTILGTVVAVSPDGKTFAMGGGDRQPVRFWDLGRLEELPPIDMGAGSVNALAFDFDGRTLAVGAVSTEIKLWNLPARQEITSLKGHSSYALQLAFSPDGRGLVSSGFDKDIHLWRTPSWEDIQATETAQTNRLESSGSKAPVR